LAYPGGGKAKPMSGTVATRMTFADLERLPESRYRQELLQGELIELPPAKRKHNKTAERFFLRLLATAAPATSAKYISEWNTGSKTTAG
jgi:Uma2 family endonuclease